MTTRRRPERMTPLEKEFDRNVRLSASIKTPVTAEGSPPPPDPKTSVEQRREWVRDLALDLVKQGLGSRVSETRIELALNSQQFRELFEAIHPKAGHAMFNNKTTLKRALRGHAASPEWPHIHLKGGRPKKATE